MIDMINRVLAPVRRRVENLIARAVVGQVLDSSTLQSLQLAILSDETRDGCERFQQYGFTSVPFADAEAVVVFVGGLRDHPLVLAVDDRRYRKKNLQPGESALYSDEGDYLLLKRGRILELLAGTKLEVTSPLAHFSGTVDVAGVYKVAGTQVVGPQLGAVPPPSGGSIVDAPARAAINTLIARLQTHGLTA
jgi:phage baseplate assembly protein V